MLHMHDLPQRSSIDLDGLFESLHDSITNGRPLLKTDELVQLLEDRADLDNYFDFGNSDQEGKTIFRPEKPQRPLVRISGRLAENTRLFNRYRMTLAHEYAHVVLHTPLYVRLFDRLTSTGAADDEWNAATELIPEVETQMEREVRHAAAALLIPANSVHRELRRQLGNRDCRSFINTRDGDLLCEWACKTFKVSIEAASIRLKQLGHLVEGPRRSTRGLTSIADILKTHGSN